MTDAHVVDAQMRAYYARRADEYDQWWLNSGLFAQRSRPGWDAETAALTGVLSGLEAATTLDVACGTGFLTQHVPGAVTAIDQSEEMVAVAAARLPRTRVQQGEAVPLPFADASFERIFTSHFYGHLLAPEAERFLAEARRVADEIVVVDSALRTGVSAEEWQKRTLNDGSTHRVYKRYFTPAELAAELGGGDVLFSGTWFVAVRAPRRSAGPPG